MPWYQLDDANDPKLDELARQYNLHPLHIEDTSNPYYDLLTRPNSNNLSAPQSPRLLASLKENVPTSKEIFMTDYRVAKGEAQEDQITASIEKFTAQVPSSVYLALALGSMATSLAFQAAKKQHEALFVGQWAAPFLILGIYNKLVKIHGSDGTSENADKQAYANA